MKIIVASTIVPFINGGGNFIVDWLAEKLKESGHEVETLKIPFSSHYKDMLSQMLALRLYHLENECDRLICIRMPSYLLPHPQKYLWFIHHYREVYDLWKTELDYLPKDAEMLSIRENIMRADDVAFAEAKKIYTNSKIVSKRLLDYNGIGSEVLYPPLSKPEQFFCDSYGDYIYYSSRICVPKRQLLAVEAMKFTKTNVRLVISGKPEQESYAREIESCIRKNGLEKKVKIIDRWISEEEKAELFAKCLASVYIPYDEDSYGYSSLESFHSRKAVISCKDSGGVRELIKTGENGYLLEADPRKLAEVFDRLYEQRELAEKLGREGLESMKRLGITWENVIRRFTE